MLRISQVIFDFDISGTGRLDAFLISLKNSSKSFLGYGWGSFEEITTGQVIKTGENILQAQRAYPHNFILETILEGGWILGIGTVFLFLYSKYKMVKLFFLKGNIEYLALFSILLYLFTASMFSNDWNDNRDLFVMLSISLTLISKEYIYKC